MTRLRVNVDYLSRALSSTKTNQGRAVAGNAGRDSADSRALHTSICASRVMSRGTS